MKYKDKQAFLSMEAVSAFVIFTFMVMLYLPAYYLEIERIQDIKTETDQWALFANLVEVDLDPGLDLSIKEAMIDGILEQTSLIVSEYYCDSDLCRIHFKEGEHLYVEKE